MSNWIARLGLCVAALAASLALIVTVASANMTTSSCVRGCSSSRSHKPFPVQVCRPYSSRRFFDVRVRHMSCSRGRRILAGAHLGDKRSRVRGFACRQFSLSLRGPGFPYDIVCSNGPAWVRAGVCDGPCPTSTTGLPRLLAGSFSGIRPRDVFFSADAGNIVINITWQHWNHTSGVGHGTSNILSCIPDCAQGKATPVATSVTFSKPVRGHFTKVVEVRAGRTLVGHYPRPWPVEGAQAASAAASCGKLRIVRRSANYGVTASRIRARSVTCRSTRALIVRVVDASRSYLNAPRFFHDVAVGGYRCHYVRAGFDVGTESCRSGRRGVLWQEQHGRLSQGY